MTTPDTRCPTTDLITDQCAHCRHIPDPPPDHRIGRPIEARYPGACRADAAKEITP